MIRAAPVSVVTLMLVAAAAGWWFASTTYSGEIKALKAHLDFRADQRDDFQRKYEEIQRRLTPEEAASLSDVLSGAPGEVTLAIGDDLESQSIGQQLEQLFGSAGWSVDVRSDADVNGVSIIGEDDASRATIERGLRLEQNGQPFMQLPHDGKAEPSLLR